MFATPRARSARACALALVVMAALLAVASPAAAESECVTDSPADVENRADNTITDRPEADILAACTEHTEDVVEIAVRVTQPTDPMTDPAWADLGATVGASIDVGDGGEEEFDVNYARFGDGPPRVKVFVHDTPQELCDVDGIFDGVRYRLRIPVDCIGDPAQVSTAAYVFYSSNVENQLSQGFFDETPTRPNFVGPYTEAADPATAVQRLAGLSRVDTAIAVSQDDFEPGSAGAVVLARADQFPDALVAAPLATSVDGPLLLTPSFSTPQVVRDEIQRVLPAGGTVYLSGGEVAIEAAVADEIAGLGYTVERLNGITRYETAVEVAEAAVPEPQLIVVADGNTFPDALVGGSLAAAEGGVEILSDGSALDPAGQAYLDAHPGAEVLAIGAAAAAAVPSATPIVGDDVFETSVLVAERYGDVEAVGIASGTNFPDGLTGGAHAGRAGIPLLLSWPDVLPTSVESYLDAQAPLQSVTMYGGVVALSHTAEEEAAVSLS